MPIGLTAPMTASPDDQDEAAASLTVPQSERGSVLRGAMDFSQRALHFGQHLVLDTLGVDPADPVSQEQGLGNIDQRISADAANQRYGLDGYLRFNQPTTPDDASWMNAQANERRYRDIVLARTRATPLTDIGNSLAGSLTDPLGLALMVGTDGIGEAALDATGLASAAKAGMAVSKLGRVGNVAADGAYQLAKGAAFNAPYVGVNAALSNYAGEDYSMGDGLRDIAAGAILHTGLHFGGKALDAALGRFGGSPAPKGDVSAETPAGTPPEAVQSLDPAAREGAFAQSLDDTLDDRPVDVGQYVQRELDAQAAAKPPEGPGAASDPSDPAPAAQGMFPAPGDGAAQPLEPQAEPTPPEPVEGAAAPEPAPQPNQAEATMAQLADRYARNDPGDLDLRAPGKAAEPVQPAEVQRLDLTPEPAKPKGGKATKPEAPEPGEGEAPKPPRATGDQLIAADPELKALAEDTDRLARENGLEAEPLKESEKPNTLAEAVRAAAICAVGELG